MMNNFQLLVILQNQNQSMAMKNRISLVFPFLNRRQRLQRNHIFNKRRKTAEQAKLIV